MNRLEKEIQKAKNKYLRFYDLHIKDNWVESETLTIEEYASCLVICEKFHEKFIRTESSRIHLETDLDHIEYEIWTNRKTVVNRNNLTKEYKENRFNEMQYQKSLIRKQELINEYKDLLKLKFGIINKSDFEKNKTFNSDKMISDIEKITEN